MKRKKCYLVFLLLIFLSHYTFATTYYLSESGNDSNNGLSTGLAWRSISKLNSMMRSFLPGDEILFERGSFFTGQINVTVSGDNGNPVTFGAYGEGRNPIIWGSIPVANWTLYKGKIYKANTDSSVSNLFLNGRQMTIARYPNSGFLTIDEPSSNPKRGFFDDELDQVDEFWNGSNVRMRTINWAYEYAPVQNFSDGEIDFEYETFYPTLPGWGYYLDNNLSKLDTAGEWYYEEVGNSIKTVYFYPPAGIDLNNASIEASIYEYGFFSVRNLMNIIIRDIEIKNQTIAAISFSGDNSNVRIENCTFTGQIQQGINFPRSSENCVVTNCKFFNINGNAINVIKSTRGIFSKNIVRTIGMIPGYGTTGTPFTMTAMAIRNSDYNQIVENNLNIIGHCGINNTGTGNLVEKNVVSNSMLLLNDGAAIKCYGLNSRDCIWRNNFIFNVPGNIEGTNNAWVELKVHGMYLDALSNNNSIVNNTITECLSGGINLNNGCKNNKIEYNTSYGNQSGIRFYEGEEIMSNNQIENNIFLGLNSEELAVYFRAAAENFQPATFKSNYYGNPFTQNICLYQIKTKKSFYNLNEWKSLLGNNNLEGAKLLPQNEVKYSKLYCNMSDESLTIPLEPGVTYKDLNLNIQQVEITIQPWSSVILLTSSDLSGSAEISIAGGPLTFNNSGSIAAQWYNVIGNNLTQPLSVTAPDGFEVSLNSDINFSRSLSINPENGKVSRIIFVKFVPGENKDYNTFISNQSGGVNSVIKVSSK